MKRPHILLNGVDLTALFALIPNEIVLDMSGRDIEPGDPDTCLCGWALRESLAVAAGLDAEAVQVPCDPTTRLVSEFTCEALSKRFGGTIGSWAKVFWGVTYHDQMPVIEEAWTQRVMRAVGVPWTTRA